MLYRELTGRIKGLVAEHACIITFTNVTPIIWTHNILTSHNRTHKTPLEPIKKLYHYGFVSEVFPGLPGEGKSRDGMGNDGKRDGTGRENRKR
jgi:hypothetical protein